MLTGSSSGPRPCALAIGPEVPAGDFEFRVHSQFASALNLLVGNRRFLVSLLGAGADDQPQGIRLASRERFDAWPVCPGDPGRRTGDRLVFEGAGPRALVDLAPAVPSRPRAMPRLDPRDPSWWPAWRECARALDELQEREGAAPRLAALYDPVAAGGPLASRLAQGAAELAGCIHAGNADSAARAASRIIGLGTGLTPAGDDFLCGLLAALWCTSAGGGRERRFLVGWGAALAARLGATNAVGATMLECAIAGSFCGALYDLADALAGGRRGMAGPAPRVALGRLCAMGHSSGMDTATGFLFGLSIGTGAEARAYAPSV